MSIVKSYACYDYNKEWYLVEMLFDLSPSEIDWCNIVVPEEGTERSSWQCAYMEQYLNETGTEKVCETYCTPDNKLVPCRVVFFIYKGCGTVLHTPYGEFNLSSAVKVPARLAHIIEFHAISQDSVCDVSHPLAKVFRSLKARFKR